MLKEKEVKIISMFGYWHLHREENEKHYFGFSDHRLGLSIRTETADKVKEWRTREPKIEQSFTDSKGELVVFTDEPYTETQISSFKNLTVEQLDRWVEIGN